MLKSSKNMHNACLWFRRQMTMFERLLKFWDWLWMRRRYITSQIKSIKVHTATRWTIKHGLMLLWFTDLMNVTEEVTIHRPNVSTLLSSAFIRSEKNYLHSSEFSSPRTPNIRTFHLEIQNFAITSNIWKYLTTQTHSWSIHSNQVSGYTNVNIITLNYNLCAL